MASEESPRLLLVARRSFASEIALALAPNLAVHAARTIAEAQARVRSSSTEFAACAIDASLPADDGLRLAEWVADTAPGLSVLLVARAATHEIVAFAALRGIPLVLWPFDAQHVAQILDNARRRAIEQVARALRENFEAEARHANLTPQESEVAWITLLGATSSQAARARGVTLRTVEHQRYDSLTKLKAKSMNEFRWRQLARVLPDWRKLR